MGFIIIGLIFLVLVAVLIQSAAGRVVLLILLGAAGYLVYWKFTGGRL